MHTKRVKVETINPPGAGARADAVNTVAAALGDARTSEEVAGILKSHPIDIAHDALWCAIHSDHEQVAAHEVGAMRLKDHAGMLRSATRSRSSHLDQDIPF